MRYVPIIAHSQLGVSTFVWILRHWLPGSAISASKHLATSAVAAVAGLEALLLLLASTCLSHPAYAQEGNQAVTVTDLLKVKELSDVKLSPDGRQVLYSVRSVVPSERRPSLEAEADHPPASEVAEAYEYRTQLHIADAVRPADNRQLTHGDVGATDAAWHPDGDRIAFVRPVDGTSQIFILPLLGGEAYAVTDLESGASAPRWSRDGSRLLFASSLTAVEIRRRIDVDQQWPSERPGPGPEEIGDVTPNPDGSVSEIRAWLDSNAARLRPRLFHRLNFVGELDLEAVPKYQHWFVIEPDAVDAQPTLITRGLFEFEEAEWMADGSHVLVSGLMRTDIHPDRLRESELYLAAADGSGMTPYFSMENYAVSSPVVSPDGNAVAFTASHLDDAGFAQNEIGVLPVADPDSARLLTLDFDRSTSSPKWSPDSWHLYFTAASNGGVPLYRVAAFDLDDRQGPPESDSLDSAGADSLPGAPETTAVEADSSGIAADSALVDVWQPALGEAQVERLTSFERGIRSFDVGSAALFYVATEVANPYELFVSDTPYSSDRRLTDHNASWLSAKRISYPKSYSLMRDSLEIQYWIMKPAFFDSTESYPLLLQIHGGPSAMWGPGEASMWHELQFFASRGYGIVFSNPRGSGGYGRDFRRANYRDWGAGPAGDVLAVASEAVREPWLDPDRQVVTGGSYAGYLTAWIIGHDHRFKAAVAQRGVYDLGTFLGEGNAWRLVPTHFGGFPWDRDVDSLAVVGPGMDVSTASADTAWIETASADPAWTDTTLAYPVWTDADLADTASIDTVAVADSSIPDTFVDMHAPEIETTEVLEPHFDPPLSVSEILIRNSPLTYVDQIRTPLLIIHGDLDLRTGVGQSEVLYRSLKILERPVEYVRYPDSGHELSRSGDPYLRMDRILRIYEFMERFIP